MRRAWIVGCFLLLAACSKKETASAVDLSVQYKDYVPKCLRVTVADARAPEANTSSDTLDADKLAAHADPADRTVRIAVFREKDWSQELKIDVASYSTEDCEESSRVETRGLASVTLPEKGRVTPEPIKLLARDSDGDGYIAESTDEVIQQDTDCDDNASNTYPGAKPKECGLVPDPKSDFNCDDVPECARRPNGESCNGAAMCESGFCVAGICCLRACDSPPDVCRGAPTCSGGTTCNYPIVVDKPCDDGSKCTTVDTCNAQGKCVGSSPVVCPTRSDTCISPTGTCVPSDGGCYYPPLDAGTVCNDSNGCTLNERCNGLGSCTGGTEKVCNSGTPGWPNQCHGTTGTCIPADGGCVFPVVDAGTACDDGTACSHTDRCNAGACNGTPYSCPPPNECQTSGNACAGDGGCLYSADTSKNGQTCTLTAGVSGTCAAGKCNPFPYVPSNFDPNVLSPTEIADLKAVRISCDTTFDSTNQTWTLAGGCPDPVPAPDVRSLTQTGGPTAILLSMKKLDIDAGKTLRLVGDKPVVLAVYGDAMLSGKLMANGVKQQAGAGGVAGNCGTRAGANGTLDTGDNTAGGGGGGGLGTAGGLGGKGDSNNSPGGAAGLALSPPTHQLEPLVGGCPGGAGGHGTLGGAGGAGGGAVQISVSGTMQVNDLVTLSGGSGLGGRATTLKSGGGGGGGSGGGLLLEAANLDITSSAKLTANGGGGGQGGKKDATTPVDGGDGTDGYVDLASQAPGGSGSAGGAGGKGGISGSNPDNGADGNNNNGGGGGGGAIGRIRLMGTKTCTVNASLISPSTYSKGGACP